MRAASALVEFHRGAFEIPWYFVNACHWLVPNHRKSGFVVTGEFLATSGGEDPSSAPWLSGQQVAGRYATAAHYDASPGVGRGSREHMTGHQRKPRT